MTEFINGIELEYCIREDRFCMYRKNGKCTREG
jgi:hypothetical protein